MYSRLKEFMFPHFLLTNFGQEFLYISILYICVCIYIKFIMHISIKWVIHNSAISTTVQYLFVYTTNIFLCVVIICISLVKRAWGQCQGKGVPMVSEVVGAGPKVFQMSLDPWGCLENPSALHRAAGDLPCPSFVAWYAPEPSVRLLNPSVHILSCSRVLHMPSCVPLSPVLVLAVCHQVFCSAVSPARVFPVLFGVLQGQLFLFPCIAGLSLCLVRPEPSVCPCHPLILSWFSFYCTPRALHLFSCPLNTPLFAHPWAL